MDSASLRFIAFGLLVAALSGLSSTRWWRSLVLTASSLGFLVLLDRHPLVYLPLAGFLLLGYVSCSMLQRGKTRSAAWGVLAILFVYIWLKKYTFLPPGMFLRSPYFTLGLSYIFFRVLHLVIDSGQEGEKPHVTPLPYLLYTLNFTTLISGPIQRYEDFIADQYAEQPPPLGLRVVGFQLERIIRGFFKVNVLATLLNAVREDAVAQLIHPYAPMPMRYYAAFRVAAVYPFFLYCNFSGYMDVVIAIARLMRLRLPENFDRPFSASSFIDFWNRWHITLSAWLKAYVYNPLLVALMRRIEEPWVQPFLGVVSLFVTFFLVGVWHGRTSEFIFFGVLQGGGVAVNKLWQMLCTNLLGRKRYKSLATNNAYVVFSRGLTFSWFAFTLVWFWAGWNQISKMFYAIGPVHWVVVWLVLWVLSSVVLAGWESLRSMLLATTISAGPLLTSRYTRIAYASALAVLAIVLTKLLSQPAPAIVYKGF